MHAVRTAARGFAFIVACLCVSGGSAQSRGDKTCVLDGTSVMAFGSYDPMSDAPLDVQGRVSYRCGVDSRQGAAIGRSAADARGKLIVQISISAGNAGSFNRYMQGDRDRLRYNLYLDSQHSRIWGDGTGGSSVYSAHAQPNNKVEVVPVFGRIFATQDVGGGFYLDDLIVTLDF